MPNRRHGGRPWGPLQAQTPEAEELALFLRAQIDASPLTMTAVAQKINYSRTQTGQYLSGRVPGQDFVTAVIRVTVPEPRMHERRQAEASRLLAAANNPAPAQNARRVSDPGVAGELERVRAQQVDTYERLTRSLEQQAALQETARNSAQLVMVLLTMISTLEGRVQSLSAERDQLRGGVGDGRVLEDTQQRLARALDQERRAQEELDRARDKQRQAEELAVHVQVQVRELTDELDRLRAESAHTPNGEPPEDPETTSRPTPGGMASDPVGDDIEQALAQAAAVNDTDDETLQRITHELHDDIDDAAPRAPLPVRVVRDNQDNTPTSTATPAAERTTQDRVQAYANHIADLTDAFGPDHQETLAARSDHAHFVGQAGDVAEAARLHGDLVLGLVRALGPDHVDTLAARSDHAYYVGQAGDVAEAARLYGDLASSFARALKPDYVETLVARSGHASYVGRAGDTAGAVDLYTDLIPDLTRVLGPDHAETLAARSAHALYVGESGDAARAAFLYADLIPVLGRTVGRDHRATLAARGDHALYVGESGDAAEAVKLHARLITDLARVLGRDHAETLVARSGYAHYVGLAGDAAEAAELLAGLIPHLTRVLGPDHHETLVARGNHALYIGKDGDAAAAVELLADLIPDLTRVLGPDHQTTLAAHSNRAHYAGQGKAGV